MICHAGGDDRLHFLKLFRLDDGIERPFRPDPHLRAIRDPLLLQLEGAPVVDVVADGLEDIPRSPFTRDLPPSQDYRLDWRPVFVLRNISMTMRSPTP